MGCATPSLRKYSPSSILLCVLSVVVTFWWSEPLWLTAGQTGGNDWGVMLNVWEVRWKSLFEYGQWPAFNPWQGGGLPVNPALGYFSVQAVATLSLGPKAGLSVFILCYLLIGLWGFWRLGLLLFASPASAFFLAILGTASPAFTMHLSVGHLIYANFMVWPAIIYLLLRAAEDSWSGLKAGILFALGFNELAYYIMQYGGMIAAGLWLWRFTQADQPERKALSRYALLAVAGALPFMIPPFVSIVMIASDYARIANTPTSFTVSELWQAYFVPDTELKPAVFVPTMQSWWGTWEINCYLGWGSVLFFGFGLLRGLRWFHVALVICFIFTIGNLHWWEPMRWLMATPAFASLQSFARLRLFTQLFFALGATWGLALALNDSRWPHLARPAVLLLAGVALAEILVVSRRIASRSHFNFTTPFITNDCLGEFYQRGTRLGLPAVIDGWPADLVLYTRANIGIVRESAAIDSSFRQPSRVRTVNDSDYLGEFVQGTRAVRPVFWSPNRITFEGLDPTIPLSVNLNRGHPWRNFERPLFPKDRVVEFDKPFVVQPDGLGRVDLTYVLPGQRESWWASGAALMLSVAFAFYLRLGEN